MSEHEFKFGDWGALTHDGTTIRVRWVSRYNGLNFFIHLDGRVRTYDIVNVEHLPDCDSWSWQPTPKLQLREGAWYERGGKTAGPCRMTHSATDYKWSVGNVLYDDAGKCCSTSHFMDLIREVPAPAPKYRPFANAAEFAPHRDRWLRGNACIGRIYSYSDLGVCSHPEQTIQPYETLCEKVVFEDTGLPCGVEVTE